MAAVHPSLHPTVNGLAPHQQADHPPRYRQGYPGHVSPNERPYNPYADAPTDVKDTQLLQPNFDQGYHPNGAPGYHRSRTPTYQYAEDTTLSTFLHNLFLSAKNTISTRQVPSYLTPSSSELSLPYLNSFLAQSKDASAPISTSSASNAPAFPTFKIPAASTLGFMGLCGLWYLSSAFSSNTGKTILTRFRYPVTLTFVQFAFVAAYCVLFLSVREQLSGGSGGPPPAGLGSTSRRGSLGTAAGWGIKKPTKGMFHGTLMMSLFQIAGHVFSSMAIARVPVSTVHTIKALSPLFTVASYAVLFKVRYSPPTYIALVPLTLGVMLACSFDMRANAVGFICALGSTLIFVSQNIFSKKLLPKENQAGAAQAPTAGAASGRLDKLNLLFYSSGMAFFLMIPIWLWSDGSALFSVWFYGTTPLHSSKADMTASTSSLVLFFFLNGTVHFAQNLLAFSILARTSPVTYSIASLIKRIAVICIAIVWSGQTVSFVQGMGMAMTFAGLWMYNRAKGDVDKGERKRDNVEKRSEMFLPTTAEDARVLDGATSPAPSSNYQPSPQASAYGVPPPSNHSTPRQPPHPLPHNNDSFERESVANAPIAGGAPPAHAAVSRKGSQGPIPLGFNSPKPNR
ncbi:DUF251 domain membrane protein [Pseudohyphozyma bogoriensis]|nr:DUF251 domain membrane protein [Pseudohyphozyma bogoriensis]